MENRIFNEQNGLWYELLGDYYLPCLALSNEEQVGNWVMGTVTFEVSERTSQGYILQSADKRNLNGYLVDINKQAVNMFYRLVKELAEKENITEQLKSTDQMLWVQKMNNIRNRATEIVNKEIVYA